MEVLRGGFCEYCGFYVAPNNGRIIVRYEKPPRHVRVCKECYQKQHDGVERIDMYAIRRNKV